MLFTPEDTLPPKSLAAVCAAYGLGSPLGTVFVARGSMGAVNRITTELDGDRRFWTVKRSYWNHYTDEAIRREVEFTEQCRSVGVRGPRSIRTVDGNRFVLTLDDQPGAGTQYRVMDWLDGTIGSGDDPDTTRSIAGWLAAIHTLAADTDGQPIDEWFIQVRFQWDDLAGRLMGPAPDLAELIRTRRRDLRELTELVNSTGHEGAIWCHTDVGPDNVIWLSDGPWLIDWENSGPLVPRQELGAVVRAHQEHAVRLYADYRRAGGPAEFTETSDLATSAAVHLNYLGVQSELLLDETHPEQHDFARAAATRAAHRVPTLTGLESWIADLSAVG